MITLLPFLGALCGGIVTCVLTLVFGQRIQHYFWTRQRQAEWQKAVIEDVTKLTAETQFLLDKRPEDIQVRDERLSMALSAAIANARALFSPPNAATIQHLHPIIAEALRLPAQSLPQERFQVGMKLMHAHHMALIALYQDMGIPVHPHEDVIALYRVMGILGGAVDHTRLVRLSTGFRRLSLTLGTIAGLGIPVWVMIEVTPAQFGPSPWVVLGIIAAFSFAITWGVFWLIGWTILGFCSPIGPHETNITPQVAGEKREP